MRINFNKEDIEILINLIHDEHMCIIKMKNALNYLKITEKEKNKRIKEYEKFIKKLKKINNSLMDKKIEMEYYEEQNTKHTDNRKDNTFFNYVADIMSRD